MRRPVEHDRSSNDRARPGTIAGRASVVEALSWVNSMSPVADGRGSATPRRVSFRRTAPPLSATRSQRSLASKAGPLDSTSRWQVLAGACGSHVALHSSFAFGPTTSVKTIRRKLTWDTSKLTRRSGKNHTRASGPLNAMNFRCELPVLPVNGGKCRTCPEKPASLST